MSIECRGEFENKYTYILVAGQTQTLALQPGWERF